MGLTKVTTEMIAQEGPDTAIAGSVMKIQYLFQDSIYPLEDEAAIWPNKTETFFGVSKTFDVNDGDLPSPLTALFAFANNDGSGGDVVGLLADSVARVDDAIVFGANIIARNETGTTNTKLVGLEIDVEPAVGTTVDSGSGGLFINAFSIAMPAPAIMTGGIGGGTFNNGIVLYGIADTGAGLSPGGGETMQSLVDSGGGSYILGAVVLSNTHRVIFRGTSTTNAQMYNDNANNFRIVNGAGNIAFRDKTDLTSIVSIADNGIMTLCSTGTINFDSAQTETSAVAGGASALPATPAGYVNVQISGVTRRVPYYA